MPVSVVVGGQYGSEGKGKLVAHLAATHRAACVVRCGGSNAGHTVQVAGRTWSFRQLPAAAMLPEPLLVICAGALVDVDLLHEEISQYQVDPRRVLIDRNAALITPADGARERALGLRDSISSTLSGTGSATARKVLRSSDVRLVRDSPELRRFACNASDVLNDLLDRGQRVIVEGTQGFGLSLHHTRSYPYATSRDTTAAAFVSDAGLSPLAVDEVITVFRTFPIRVAGQSGPLAEEIDWPTLTREAGSPSPLCELTTVTRQVRRVARFDWGLAAAAIRANRPTAAAIHGLDYLDFADRGVREYGALSARSRSFTEEFQSRLGVTPRWVFTGPGQRDIVEVSRLRLPWGCPPRRCGRRSGHSAGTDGTYALTTSASPPTRRDRSRRRPTMPSDKLSERLQRYADEPEYAGPDALTHADLHEAASRLASYEAAEQQPDVAELRYRADDMAARPNGYLTAEHIRRWAEDLNDYAAAIMALAYVRATTARAERLPRTTHWHCDPLTVQCGMELTAALSAPAQAGQEEERDGE